MKKLFILLTILITQSNLLLPMSNQEVPEYQQPLPPYLELLPDPENPEEKNKLLEQRYKLSLSSKDGNSPKLSKSFYSLSNLSLQTPNSDKKTLSQDMTYLSEKNSRIMEAYKRLFQQLTILYRARKDLETENALLKEELEKALNER
jgi:hypothetical protein